jgi:hypothetical protein
MRRNRSSNYPVWLPSLSAPDVPKVGVSCERSNRPHLHRIGTPKDLRKELANGCISTAGCGRTNSTL